ncbi:MULTISPECIES: hypothetical protein [unclassified Fibrobacter]|uniref:hypothetical protein n=1 Tax=unclassified Fibrobacter TaxID=2634177 RepID=UPI000D6CCB1C|nr:MULTISPECIES: hypothetical protein [unclassified Fibrobacter]PWJ63388.1 hypothetical protein BGX12_11866 [Fibrobacter sp. UWR4]PZW68323.1 hypothetical protein C8E88_101867 [Fibrobacter sp. UWR1]
MKTKITSFLKAAVLSVLALAPVSFAEEDNGFYEKDHVRGFISFGADYRLMTDEFQSYVNKTALYNGQHQYTAPGDSSTSQLYGGKPTSKYGRFDDYYMGLHVNVGAQYKQFLTWMDINFMPTQVSERPASSYSATPLDESSSGDAVKFPLYDVKWFSYGVDWMFGWKLFGESTFINLIPAVGIGFNLINFHFASDYTVTDGSNTADARDRYYSTFASTFAAELELRLELDPIAIGLYAGYRYIRYNELDVEGVLLSDDLGNRKYDTDNDGDTFCIGLRVTWTFLSDWQRKQMDKL